MIYSFHDSISLSIRPEDFVIATGLEPCDLIDVNEMLYELGHATII